LIGLFIAITLILQQQLVVKSTIPDLSSGPVNITWKKGTPAPVTSGDYTAQGVVFNGAVYVGGGGSPTNPHFRIDIYYPSTDNWGSTIETPHKYFAMTVLMDKLVIIGGKPHTGTCTNKLLVLEMDQWKDYTKMPTARSRCVAVSHKSMMIVMGGHIGKEVVSITELLDATTRQWFKCTDLPQPLLSHYSLVIGDMLYLLGGIDHTITASTAVYAAPVDTLTSHQLKWRRLKDTPLAAITAVGMNDKHVLVVGGRKEQDTVHVLKDGAGDSSSWKCIGSLPAVHYYTAAVSVDNKIIVIGGKDFEDIMTNTVSIGTLQ